MFLSTVGSPECLLLADPANSVTEVCRLLKVSRSTAYRLARAGTMAAKAAKKSPASKPAAKVATGVEKKGNAVTMPPAAATAGKNNTLKARQLVGRRKAQPK